MVVSRIRSWFAAAAGLPRREAVQRSWWDAAESIDYTPINNDVILSTPHIHRRHVYGFSGRTFATVLSTVLVGVLIGVVAWTMEMGIGTGLALRNKLFADVASDAGLKMALVALVCMSVAAVILSAAAVQWVAPGAAGSGVSLVMAFLNGNNLHGLLTPAVCVVKLLGTIASRAAGLALGPEAPLVHLGACVASLVFGTERRWVERMYTSSHDSELEMDHGIERYRSKYDPLLRLFSNSSHRQIVSAGSAAGLAAAFGAPIGGVLFSLEEASSVWSRKTAWRCLLCSSVAVFTLSQLNPNLQGGLLAFQGVYPLSSRQWLKQLPFVTLVSVGGGLLGALFNLLRRGVQYLRASSKKHILRSIEAAGVAALTIGVIGASSHYLGRCLDLPPSWDPSEVIQFNCGPGRYNDLSTAFLSSAPWVIRSLLGLGSETEPINMNLLMSNATTPGDVCSASLPCYFSIRALITFCILYLLLMVLSSGLAVPGGLFMPCIMVGSSFGAVMGVFLSMLLPNSWDIQPGIYALVGAAATLCAVFRSNISLVVIIVEGTSGISFLPGILAAIIVSNFIAHYIHPDGVYEGELERDGRVVFLRQEPPSALRWRTARDIAASPVTCLQKIEPVEKILEVLKETTYNGYPVLSMSNGASVMTGAENGGYEHGIHQMGEMESSELLLEGFILRSQLLVLLQQQAFCNSNGDYLDPPSDVLEFEAHLEGLMEAAKFSSDGLGGQLEQRLNPLAINAEGDLISVGASPAMVQTVETIRLLRDLPSFRTSLPQSPSNRSRLHGNDHIDNMSMGGPPLFLNLGPFMDRGVITVRPQTPAVMVHRLFVGLSLRHLCVTDKLSRVTGIITRRDLDIASGSGWWRVARMAASREDLGGLIHSQSSWLASSLQALIQVPSRTVSDVVQRLSSVSPLQGRTLASADEEQAYDSLLENVSE